MTLAVVLIPCVLQSAADQHQVVLAEHLDAVAHDAARSVAVFHEVQLHFLVLVKGIGEGFLVAVHHQETVFLSKRRDFCDYFVCHGIET